jgi:hypothetical protein
VAVGRMMPRYPSETVLAGACQRRSPLAGRRGCQARGGIHGAESGEAELPPPSSSSSSSSSMPPPEDSGLDGDSSPRALTVALAVLQARLLCLRSSSRSLLIRLASHLAASSSNLIPYGALRSYPRSCVRMCMH